MLAASTYLIVFRVVHILAAIAWGGAVFLLVFYVTPSAAAIAPAGAPFIREMLGRRRMVDGILALAATTIIGGMFLYWHRLQEAGSFGDWVESSSGGWLTIGSIAAILAFLIGLFVTRPNVQRMLALGGRIAESGGPPTPEQAEELRATQTRMKVAARISLGLIGIAAFAMATARYW